MSDLRCSRAHLLSCSTLHFATTHHNTTLSTFSVSFLTTALLLYPIPVPLNCLQPPQKNSSGRLHVIPAAQKAISLPLDLGNHSNITSQASFLGASMNFCAHIHWSLIVIIFHMSVSYTKLHVPWRWEPYLLHFGIHSPSTVPACCMRLMTAKKTVTRLHSSEDSIHEKYPHFFTLSIQENLTIW